MYIYFVFGLFAALQCYACSWSSLVQGDASCVTNASAVRSLNCSMKYCLTVRQELMVSRRAERRSKERRGKKRASRQASVSCTSSKSSHNLATRSPRPLNFCSTLLPQLSSARTRAEPQLWRNKVAAAAFDHLFFFIRSVAAGATMLPNFRFLQTN